jgi:hypothetical protein
MYTYYHLTTHLSIITQHFTSEELQYKSADNSLYLVVPKSVLKAVIQIKAITFNIHNSFPICCLQHIKMSMIYKMAQTTYDNTSRYYRVLTMVYNTQRY